MHHGGPSRWHTSAFGCHSYRIRSKLRVAESLKPKGVMIVYSPFRPLLSYPKRILPNRCIYMCANRYVVVARYFAMVKSTSCRLQPSSPPLYRISQHYCPFNRLGPYGWGNSQAACFLRIISAALSFARCISVPLMLFFVFYRNKSDQFSILCSAERRGSVSLWDVGCWLLVVGVCT